jgi:hypothetical protein
MYYAFGALFSHTIKSINDRDFVPPNFIRYGSANVTGINQKARHKVCPFL